MISPHATESALTGMAATLAPLLVEPMCQLTVDAVSVPCGWQDDGCGGGFELRTLTQAIPGHPVNSTVSRQTIERALFGANYGSAILPTAKDFQAVESPSFKKSHFADAKSEEMAEARALPVGRVNIHDL